jgi:hypothetical protein
MFQDLLDAVHHELPPDSLTLVVDNYDMRVGVRAQNHQARELLSRVEALLKNPMHAVQQRPETRELASVLADYARHAGIDNARIRKPRARKPLAKLDDTFAETMSGAARSAPAPKDVIIGTTDVYSTIFRVGRLNSRSAIRARVMLAGRPRDVKVAEDAAEKFFDAAKSGKPVRVRLRVEWIRGTDGSITPHARRTTAVGLETSWAPVAGGEILRHAAEGPPIISSDQLLEILENSEDDH